MSNLDNKEQEFARLLAEITKNARRAGGVVSENEIRETFSALELTKEQYELIFGRTGRVCETAALPGVPLRGDRRG